MPACDCTRESTFARVDIAHGAEGWRFMLRLSDPLQLKRLTPHGAGAVRSLSWRRVNAPPALTRAAAMVAVLLSFCAAAIRPTTYPLDAPPASLWVTPPT